MKLFAPSLFLAALTLVPSLVQAQYSQPVRDVENPARTPIRLQGAPAPNATFVVIQNAVPAGYVFVIEYISFLNVSQNTVPFIGIELSSTVDASNKLYIPFRQAVSNSGNNNTTYMGGELVKAYWDGDTAGSNLAVQASGVAFGSFARITINGYLVKK